MTKKAKKKDVHKPNWHFLKRLNIPTVCYTSTDKKKICTKIIHNIIIYATVLSGARI